MERFNLRLLIKAGAAILLFCSSAAFAEPGAGVTGATGYQENLPSQGAAVRHPWIYREAAVPQSVAFRQLYGEWTELLPTARTAIERYREAILPRRVVSSNEPPIENLGTVLNGAYYRGAKLEDEEAYMFLSNRLGVTTVITLRYPQRDDEQLCRKYRLNCIYRGVKMRLRKFDYETFREAFRITVRAGESGERVYFHCTYGSDRTGALAAAITLRAKACRRPFNKNALWNEIAADLKKHDFHIIYRSLYKSIKSWVYNFENNQWICQ